LILSETDLIAILIALGGSLTMLIVFFRNNYQLRKENYLLKQKINSLKPPF
jgi:uncharacterized membrane protein